VSDPGAGPADDASILYAPAAARNQEPILAVLHLILPETGHVLEIASGTGQHAVAFAAAFPGLSWQPSDPDPTARASIADRVAQAGLANLRPPLDLDVSEPDWDRAIAEPVDAIVCINLLHIAPWRACEGLMGGARRILRPSGLLYLYGAYIRDGHHTAPSNAAFDRALRRQNPEWGVRDLAQVVACAKQHELRLERVVEMPANNLSVVFRAA
jgi:cyclopropane fatty-acyl-phospholipid synthase-like methyltransferase